MNNEVKLIGVDPFDGTLTYSNGMVIVPPFDVEHPGDIVWVASTKDGEKQWAFGTRAEAEKHVKTYQQQEPKSNGPKILTNQKLIMLDSDEGTATVETMGFTVEDIQTVEVCGLKIKVGTVLGTPVTWVEGDTWAQASTTD